MSNSTKQIDRESARKLMRETGDFFVRIGDSLRLYANSYAGDPDWSDADKVDWQAVIREVNRTEPMQDKLEEIVRAVYNGLVELDD